MSDFVTLSYQLTYTHDVPIEHYPGMTLEQAIAYEHAQSDEDIMNLVVTSGDASIQKFIGSKTVSDR